MRSLALAAIRGYQRFLSPLKGSNSSFEIYSNIGNTI
jgi:putative component of membrane protein insertase Oxa1/YidC/SpoIIIJ protein YidD